MDKAERQQADMLRDRLKKILPYLKRAYENAKILELEHGWDLGCFDMSEAYMNIADAYIVVVGKLEEEDGGGAK